jgi:FkbM family methyltransferase
MRLMAYLAEGDGVAMGRWLRYQLSSEQRRRLASTVLAREQVTLEFECGGFHWAVLAGDHISTSLLATGEYAGSAEIVPLLPWLCERTGRVGDTVIEVGANIGSTTVPLAAEGLRVIAVEPVPQAFDLLRRNVESNGFSDRVTCIRAAIAAGVTSVSMEVRPWLGDSRVAADSRAGDIEVNALGLSDLVSQQQVDVADVRFVWCDAEGSESMVIETGAPLWASGVPLLAEVGIGDFTRQAVSHFRTFIPVGEILRDGASARPKPIGALSDFDGFLEMVVLLPESER